MLVRVVFGHPLRCCFSCPLQKLSPYYQACCYYRKTIQYIWAYANVMRIIYGDDIESDIRAVYLGETCGYGIFC